MLLFKSLEVNEREEFFSKPLQLLELGRPSIRARVGAKCSCAKEKVAAGCFNITAKFDDVRGILPSFEPLYDADGAAERTLRRRVGCFGESKFVLC